mgnify:FL=1
MIHEACLENSSKLALSVPYSGHEKNIVKSEIENCLNKYPSKSITIFNTDVFWTSEYFKKKKYVGAINYKIGLGCGKAPFTDNEYIVSSRESSINLISNDISVQIYLSETELKNEGIAARQTAIVDEVTRIGGSVSTVNNVNEVNDSDKFVICMGVGAANEVTNHGKKCSFQCGDDQTFGEIPFYGQNVFNQGHMTVTSILSVVSFSENSFIIDSTESVDLTGTAVRPNITDKRDSKSVVSVSIVTHALADVGSSFWGKWKSSAISAISEDNDDKHTVNWMESGYNGTYHAQLITEVCEYSDAFGVTVPFPKESLEYKQSNKALNDCMNLHPGLPIFSMNTDTFSHEGLYGYVGSYNHQIGRECALQIATGNSLMAIQAVPPEVYAGISSEIVIYLSYKERLNNGIIQRSIGIRDTFRQLNLKIPEVVYYPENITLSSYVIALGSGAKNQLDENSKSADFQCGDNMNDDISYIGQDVELQGRMAAKLIVTAARSIYVWLSIMGNGASVSSSNSGRILPLLPPPLPPSSPPPLPPSSPPPLPPSSPPPLDDVCDLCDDPPLDDVCDLCDDPPLDDVCDLCDDLCDLCDTPPSPPSI